MKGLPAVLLLLSAIAAAVRADLTQQGGRGYAGGPKLSSHSAIQPMPKVRVSPQRLPLLLLPPPSHRLTQGRSGTPTHSKQSILVGNQGGFQAQASRGHQAQAALADEEPDAEAEPIMPPHRQGTQSTCLGKQSLPPSLPAGRISSLMFTGCRGSWSSPYPQGLERLGILLQ